jgi:hypothetical protein
MPLNPLPKTQSELQKTPIVKSGKPFMIFDVNVDLPGRARHSVRAVPAVRSERGLSQTAARQPAKPAPKFKVVSRFLVARNAWVSGPRPAAKPRKFFYFFSNRRKSPEITGIRVYGKRRKPPETTGNRRNSPEIPVENTGKHLKSVDRKSPEIPVEIGGNHRK